MKDKYQIQLALCIIFGFFILIIASYLPFLSLTHEFGHYLIATIMGYESYIKDCYTTITKYYGKLPIEIMYAGYIFDICLYFIITLFMIILCKYSNFSIIGIPAGLFMNNFFGVSVPGNSINPDFEKIKELYSVDPYKPFNILGYTFLILLILIFLRKLDSFEKNIKKSEKDKYLS
jgi:hypothetical protein